MRGARLMAVTDLACSIGAAPLMSAPARHGKQAGTQLAYEAGPSGGGVCAGMPRRPEPHSAPSHAAGSAGKEAL